MAKKSLRSASRGFVPVGHTVTRTIDTASSHQKTAQAYHGTKCRLLYKKSLNSRLLTRLARTEKKSGPSHESPSSNVFVFETIGYVRSVSIVSFYIMLRNKTNAQSLHTNQRQHKDKKRSNLTKTESRNNSTAFN